MRYAPYAEELKAFANMGEAQLLEYFLTRVFETEEVWGLDDGCEWVTIEHEQQTLMPLWPYQQLASSNITDLAGSETMSPTAESLEDFVYQTLGQLMDEDIVLAVMCNSNNQGCLITPHRLYEILTGMFNAGEYVLDT